jgi:hypothetical protein
VKVSPQPGLDLINPSFGCALEVDAHTYLGGEGDSYRGAGAEEVS